MTSLSVLIHLPKLKSQLLHLKSEVEDEGGERAIGHSKRSTPMGCRCQERRNALKRAAQAKTLKAAGKELGFVAKTAAQDVRRVMLHRKG